MYDTRRPVMVYCRSAAATALALLSLLSALTSSSTATASEVMPKNYAANTVLELIKVRIGN